MALFQKKQFESLAQETGNYCISFYVPTRKDDIKKEASIKLKNQVSHVAKQLADLGLKPKEIDGYLKPVQKVVDDSSIWRLMNHSLIIFRSKNTFLQTSLPLDVDEFCVLSDRFYLLPLLEIFNQDEKFFILTLSFNKNMLYQATQNEFSAINTTGIIPIEIGESAGTDVVQKSLGFRTGQSGGTFALYHGKGEGKDDRDIEREKYLNDVGNGLAKILEGYKQPLVVASVESTCAQFRAVSSFKNIHPKCVHGNFDDEDIKVVHEKACKVLQPYFDQIKNENKTKYGELPNNKTADVGEVVKAADDGRVDTLFVRKGNYQWGDFDRESGKTKLHEEQKLLDHCLLDFAARATFFHGGNVFLVEDGGLPENSTPVNAILRY